MQLDEIKNDKEYKAYLLLVDDLFNKKVMLASQEGEILQATLVLLKNYEDQHYPIPMYDKI